jgi:hypothetical protein
MMAPTLITHLNLSVSGPSGLGGQTNQVGFVIDDLDDIEQWAIAFGLVCFNHNDYEPECHFHFLDRHGIEFEIVSFSKGAAA